MTLEADIETALLDAVIAAGAAVGLPVEMPNRKIDPPTDGKYLRIDHFRNPVTNLTWGDETLFQGILQFSILYPPDIGSLPITMIGGALAALFPKGRMLTSGTALVEIQEKPSVLSEATNGHETFVPVSVRYQCFG